MSPCSASMQNQAKEHELASRCMRPILLAELTGGSPQENPRSNASTATLLLFEFIASKECKAGFKVQGRRSRAGGYCPRQLCSFPQRPL